MREHTDGDFPFANDFNAVVRDALASGTLVRSGCTVSDSGSNNLQVSIASGDVFVDGNEIAIDSQSVTLAESDSEHDRYDLVVVDDTGTAQDVTGVASSTPTAPSIPSDAALLAIVAVQAGATDMVGAEIYDARVVVELVNGTLQHSSMTIDAGHSLTGGGSVELGDSVTINHGDTSSQGGVSAGDGEALAEVDLDSHGHVTGLSTAEMFDGESAEKIALAYDFLGV